MLMANLPISSYSRAIKQAHDHQANEFESTQVHEKLDGNRPAHPGRFKRHTKNAIIKIRTTRGAIGARITSLKAKLTTINKKLSREIIRPFPDTLRVQKLKRMRLRVKDQIHSLSY
jgi:hypothetical protein